MIEAPEDVLRIANELIDLSDLPDSGAVPREERLCDVMDKLGLPYVVEVVPQAPIIGDTEPNKNTDPNG